jgi:hypothetical protein
MRKYLPSGGAWVAALVLLQIVLPTSPTAVAYAAPTPGGAFTSVWTNGPSSSEAAGLDDLGTGWARVTVQWNAIEPSGGTFNWTALDQQMAAASNGGRRIVLAIVRENPSWAAATRCTLVSDSERQQFASFMGTLANRYRGVVWQLYNEEDNTSILSDAQTDVGGCFGTASGGVPTQAGRSNYAQAIEAASAAVRAVDPTAQIATGGVASGGFISPSGGAFDAGFLPGVMVKLAQDNSLGSLDYLAVHYYSSQAGTYASAGIDLVGRVNQLRQDVIAAGLSANQLKPVISDELSYTDMIGVSNSDPNNPFNIAQRAYVPKVFARAASVDLRAGFWFWMQDAPSGLGADNAYGLKDLTGAHKPSYAALRYFNTVVPRASQFVRTLPLSGVSPKLEGYEFLTSSSSSLTSNSSLVQIVWNQTDATQIAYTVPGAISSVTDPAGNPVTWSGNVVSIGSEPRYITYTSQPVALLSQPVRLADTRLNGGPVASGASRCFTVVGLDGIPVDAAAVVLNVTAANQTINGWLTVYPSGQSVPATSTLNFGPSEYAIANGAIMRVGAGGQVCVSVGTINSVPGNSQVILDATGYLPSTPQSQLSMLPNPVRLADTRSSGGPIPTGTSRCFQIAGVGGIPSDASAVVLNMAAVGYATNGWLTAYPNGETVPGTSTLNFSPAQYAMANNAIVRIGSGGQVCVSVGTSNSVPGSSQVILDATGYLTAAGLQQMPMLTSPQRVIDTRLNGGPIQTGSSRCFTLAGVAGVPANATGVVLNLTGVGYTTQGWLTAYPAGQGIPGVSTLNFDTSESAMANGAIEGIGTGGQVCVNVGTTNATPGSSQAIIDVVGYLT